MASPGHMCCKTIMPPAREGKGRREGLQMAVARTPTATDVGVAGTMEVMLVPATVRWFAAQPDRQVNFGNRSRLQSVMGRAWTGVVV